MKGERAPKRGTLAEPDEALLAAIADGDLGALGELYDRHARDVWRAAARLLRGSADVDDVVHTVFLKAADSARSYDGRSTARAWLVGIAANVIWRQRRTEGRISKMLGSFAWTMRDRHVVDPERHATSRQETRRFDLALAELGSKKRVVFTLIELEGLTTEEVATALSLPAATVRTRLHHARRELRATLERGEKKEDEK